MQAGDTCQAIAAAAGTTVDLILENNPNVNSACSNIHPGEVCGTDVWLEMNPVLTRCFTPCPVQVLCTADEIIVVN